MQGFRKPDSPYNYCIFMTILLPGCLSRRKKAGHTAEGYAPHCFKLFYRVLSVRSALTLKSGIPPAENQENSGFSTSASASFSACASSRFFPRVV